MIDINLDSTMLPVVATPLEKSSNSAELQAWLTANKEDIRKCLNVYGAILFRGFGVGSAQEFQTIGGIFCDEFSDYVGGNSPRTKVMSHVFTSTEYPKEAAISMHNEASYLKRMPDTILFFCVKPAPKGGQTPIADCRRILNRLDPQLRSRFEQNGVLYLNNMHGGTGLGRSWMEVFGTKDRKQVETRLMEDGYQFEWKEDCGLRTSVRASAVLRHPRTQEDVWINQAEQWHHSSLAPEIREEMLALFGEDGLPHNAFFGDGSPLGEEDLKSIRKAMDEEQRIFNWKQGDILLCDNKLVMHGRQPFSGDREILVAMG